MSEEKARTTQFSFRSGRLALDFAATLMFREGPGRPRELLVDPQALSEWVTGAGLVEERPPTSDDELSAARALREAIYGIARGLVRGRRPRSNDRTLLNQHASAPPPAMRLDHLGRVRREGDTEQALSLIARDAVQLFGGDEGTRLRQCGRDGCTRFFVDRSRGQNRVWCGMRECGNRVNAAAYRQRQRQRKAGWKRHHLDRKRAGGMAPRATKNRSPRRA